MRKRPSLDRQSDQVKPLSACGRTDDARLWRERERGGRKREREREIERERYKGSERTNERAEPSCLLLLHGSYTD